MRLKGKRIAILAESMYQEMEPWRFLTARLPPAMMPSIYRLHVS